MGRLLDIGKHQVPFTIGCCTYVISIFLTAETHEYYQVLLCQGVLLGLSAGVLFGPALAILAHWFHKRRVLAYGVVACGSSIGGTVFPILVQNCIPKIGFKWTLRTCAFIVMALLIFTWFVRPFFLAFVLERRSDSDPFVTVDAQTAIASQTSGRWALQLQGVQVPRLFPLRRRLLLDNDGTLFAFVVPR